MYNVKISKYFPIYLRYPSDIEMITFHLYLVVSLFCFLSVFFFVFVFVFVFLHFFINNILYLCSCHLSLSKSSISVYKYHLILSKSFIVPIAQLILVNSLFIVIYFFYQNVDQVIKYLVTSNKVNKMPDCRLKF